MLTNIQSLAISSISALTRGKPKPHTAWKRFLARRIVARYAFILLLLTLFYAPQRAEAAVCAGATSQGTAPSGWQTYCWLDFSTYNDTTARTAAGQNFSFSLTDGSTLSFNVRTTGTPTLVSRAAPSWTGSAVGNTAFLGIPNRPILYTQAGGTNVVIFSAITITPPPGVSAVSAYSFVAADAESTNNGESISFNTNGSNWVILDQVNPISGSLYPTISGAGTPTFTENGVAGTVGGYIVGSNSATTVTTTIVGGGLQGVMFAVRFASMRLNKQISGARINAADQFKFDVKSTSSGAILGTGTSTGTGNGPYTAAAVSLASGLPITLQESMAAGSVSALSKYSSRLTCSNSNGSSTTPLPSNVATTSYSFGALQFGDAIICTFINTPFPHLRLQKALGTGGRRFNTDQFTVNITNGATTIATATTSGTGSTVTNGATAQMQITPGTTYGLSEAAAGTTVLIQYQAALSCVNAATTNGTALPTTFPSTITLQMGDVVTCTITNTQKSANANLLASKTSTLLSDPINGTSNPKAIPGATIRYEIGVINTGTLTVDANTIVITDPLPTATIAYDNSSTVQFVDGAIPSGLVFNAATDVRFSNAVATPTSFAACTYTPSAGVDNNVRHVCIRPSGTMAGATAAGQPSFTVMFRTRVK